MEAVIMKTTRRGFWATIAAIPAVVMGRRAVAPVAWSGAVWERDPLKFAHAEQAEVWYPRYDLLRPIPIPLRYAPQGRRTTISIHVRSPFGTRDETLSGFFEGLHARRGGGA